MISTNVEEQQRDAAARHAELTGQLAEARMQVATLQFELRNASADHENSDLRVSILGKELQARESTTLEMAEELRHKTELYEVSVEKLQLQLAGSCSAFQEQQERVNELVRAISWPCTHAAQIRAGPVH